MTFRSTLAKLAAVALVCPLAAQALPYADGSWGTYVSAGWGTNGGSADPVSVTREANGEYSAYAEASIPGGKLHASVITPNDPDLPSYCTVLTCSWGTSATAMLWETLTIRPGAGHQAGDLVKWSLSMDGTKTRGKWAWGDGAYATAYYYFGADANGPRYPHDLSLGAKNGVSGSYYMPADGSPLTLYYYARLSVAAYSGSVSDYSNTMSFNWVLPEGATFTSSSGQFMTAAVPEPSTEGLLLAGGGLLAWVLRRRRAVSR